MTLLLLESQVKNSKSFSEQTFSTKCGRYFFSISNTFKELFFTFMVDMMMFRSWNSWMNWCQLGCCLHFYRNRFIFAPSDAFLLDAFWSILTQAAAASLLPLLCTFFFLEWVDCAKSLIVIGTHLVLLVANLYYKILCSKRGAVSEWTKALLKREKT